MTDDTIRPESDPSRESEPRHPEEQAVDEATDEVASSEQTGEAEVVGEAVVNAPEGATVETVNDDETSDTVAKPVVEEEVNSDAAPAVESVADTESGDTAGTSTVEEAAGIGLGDAEGEASTAAMADEAGEPAGDAPGANGGAIATSTEATDSAEPAVAAAPVPADDTAVNGTRDDVFVWHPDHKGKSFDEVRAALAQDIAADQRQHRLAMDGAEESEHEALASVVGLERKWGTYDFDWAEQEPDDLADRIVAFERERERRQELISWGDYRNPATDVDDAEVAGERPPELSTSAKGLSLLLVVLLIVVILLAVWAL